MNNQTFTKVEWISKKSWPRVEQRLEDLRHAPPPRVLGIHRWSAVEACDGYGLITEQPMLPWPTLAQLASSAPTERREKLATKLRTLHIPWQALNFVHGDLSPSNLLVSPDDEFMAIDWLLDLRTRAGTPRYVPRALAAKQKNHAHDEAALIIMASELCRKLL